MQRISHFLLLGILSLSISMSFTQNAYAQFFGPNSRLDAISNYTITGTPYYNVDALRTQNYFRTSRSRIPAIGNTTRYQHDKRHVGPNGFFDRPVRDRLSFHADRIYGPQFLIPTFAVNEDGTIKEAYREQGSTRTINGNCKPYEPCNTTTFNALPNTPGRQLKGCIPDLDRECAPWTIPLNDHPRSIFNRPTQTTGAGAGCKPFQPCNTSPFAGHARGSHINTTPSQLRTTEGRPFIQPSSSDPISPLATPNPPGLPISGTVPSNPFGSIPGNSGLPGINNPSPSSIPGLGNIPNTNALPGIPGIPSTPSIPGIPSSIPLG